MENSATAGVKRIVAHPKLVNAEKRTNSAHNIVAKVKDLTYSAKIAPQKMKETCDAKRAGEHSIFDAALSIFGETNNEFYIT